MGEAVKGYLKEKELKMGVYLPLLRIMMCGKLTGPDLFDIMVTLGPDEAKLRMEKAEEYFSGLVVA